MKHIRRGFTLVEILVVIAIIMIVSAIVAAATMQVKARAKATVCASNMKQLSAALLLYAQDHDDYFPCRPGLDATNGTPFMRYWFTQTKPYHKQKDTSLACPMFSSTEQHRAHLDQVGYAMGGCLAARQSSLATADVVLLTDVTEIGELSIGKQGTAVKVSVPVLRKPDSIRYSQEACAAMQLNCFHTPPFGAVRHFGKANLILADGHLENRGPNQIRFYKTDLCEGKQSDIVGPATGPSFFVPQQP